MTNELTADSATSTMFFDKHRINLATAARRDRTDAVSDVHGLGDDAYQLDPSLSWCRLAKYSPRHYTGVRRARLVNRANDCPENGVFNQTSNAIPGDEIAGKGLHSIADQISTRVNNAEHDAQTNSGTDAASSEAARVNHCEHEDHNGFAQDNPQEVILEICWRSCETLRQCRLASS
jgi:hypothetical protein